MKLATNVSVALKRGEIETFDHKQKHSNLHYFLRLSYSPFFIIEHRLNGETARIFPSFWNLWTPKKQLYTFTKVLGEHRVKKDRKLFFSVALQAQQYQQQESQHKSHAYLDQCL